MLHKGPTGILRLAKNAIRLVCGPMGAPGTCGLVALRRDRGGVRD